MFWFIVVILLLALSFFIGYRVGEKKQSTDARAKQQAWQEGYNAATSYAARIAKEAPPAAIQPQQPASNAPPPQPQTEWTPSDQLQHSPAGGAAQVKPAGPVVPIRPVKVLTPRERELRNINVTLYVAALLIVAAAALFLSFALPPLPKLIALFVLAAAFYGVGLYVHAAKENLKPAASAFAGTGLALLPLSGIATYQTLSLSAPVVWLIFSVIGTMAIGFATIRLRSRVLAWIAVFVLVSTTMACAATVQRGILFYLLFLLVLSVLLLVLAVHSQKIRSSLFYSAVFATGQLLPLLVLGLALVMYSSLNPRDLLWVFFLVTAHLLLTIRLIEQYRLYRLYTARVTFMLLIFATGNYLGLEAQVTWAVSAVLWAGQALAVTHFAHGYRRLFSVPSSWWRIERIALWALVAGSVLVAMAQAAQPQVPWGYAVLLIPVLQLFTLSALHHRGKVEAVAIVLLAVLAVLAITASDLYAWWVLPALAVAILGLTLAFRNETHRSWHLILDLTRWLAVLVFGGFAGRALQQLLTGFEQPTGVAQGYGRSASVIESLNLAWAVGLWLPLFALWLLSTLRSKRQLPPTREHLIHFAASVVLALITLGYVVSLLKTVAVDGAPSFLALSAAAWRIVGIICVLGNVILAGWRLDSRGQQREAQILRSMVLVASAALLALSFQGPGLIGAVVGLANLSFYLLGARKVQATQWKTVYAAAAQLTFSVSIWWLANYLDFDYSGRFALLIVSVMLPQLVRLILAMRQERALSREMRWITVGLVCLLPLVLLVGDLGFGVYDRGTMLLGISMWMIHSVTGFYALRKQTKHAEFLLFATVIGLCGLVYIQGVQSFEATGWIHGPWWSMQVAHILLLTVALLCLATQWPLRNSHTLRFAPVFGTVFALFVITVATAGAGWMTLVLLVTAVQLALLVHTKKIAWLAAGSSVALLGGIGKGLAYWREGSISSLQPWMDPTWQLLLTAILLLVMSLLHGRFADPVPSYPQDVRSSGNAAGQAARIYFAAMILCTAAAGLLVHFNDPRSAWIIAGALLIFAAGAVVRFFELPTRWHLWGSDALIVLGALLAFSSYVQIRQLPVVSIFFLYFTVVAIILAARHFVGKRGHIAHRYVIASAVLASLTQISTLIDGHGLAQVFSLFFFASLIVLGLKLGQKRYIWWGAIAITVAILWFLRYLAFLWLVLAGVGLIVAAVLKLVRVERKPRGDEQLAETHAEFGRDENSRPEQDNLNS